MDCKAIEYGDIYLLHSYIRTLVFVQTITELNLRGNQIGEYGARCLFNALQSNTVRV